MSELLDGEARKIFADDLFGHIIVQKIIVDGHAEVAGNVERSARGAILHAEDLIQGIGENLQRGLWNVERVLAFENTLFHLAKLAEGES